MGMFGTRRSGVGLRDRNRDSIRSLLRTLSEHSDDVTGWEAAEVLAQRGDARAIAPLCELLEHGAAPARQHAARLLGIYRALPAVPCLVRLLSDNSRYVRAAAARSLGQIGSPDALTALVGALGDEEACVRAGAAEALAELGDARAAEMLTLAAKDEDARVREKAREALATLVGPAEDVVRVEWSHEAAGPEPETPGQSADTLEAAPAESESTEALLEILGRRDCGERLAAAEKLAAADEKRAIEPMIRSFLGCGEDYRKRVALLLGEMGRVARIALVQALEDGEAEIRAGAALALAVKPDRSAGHPQRLVRMLLDPHPLARRAAAEALAAFGWRAHSPATRAARLVALARWEEAGAPDFLSRHGDRVARAFVAALRFEDEPSRRRAVEVLVRIGRDAVVSLLRGLANRNAQARESSVRALGEIYRDAGEVEERVSGALRNALGDDCPEVREAALVALDKMAAADELERILPLLADPVDFVRVTAVEIVAHLGNGGAADALISRLDDESPDVRRVAAETLQRLCDARAIRPLLQLLEDPDHGVRHAAEAALEALERS